MFLRTLGSLELKDTVFNRSKSLLLLSYLALEGPKTRSELAQLFWVNAKDSRDSLGTALRRLSESVNGVIDFDRLKAKTTVICDASELLKLLDNGQTESALELYKGPFLEGVNVSGVSEEIQEWLGGTRDYLAGRLRKALVQLAMQKIALNNLGIAVKYAETAWRLARQHGIEPEELQYLYALLTAGNSPLASEVRKEAKEFGIEVTYEDAKARVQQAINQTTNSEIPNNLPVRSNSFIGRTPELLEIANFLIEPLCYLLTVHGPAGIGKSRLAIQAARHQLNERNFREGIFFVDLDILTSPEQIPSRIADVLGLSLQGQIDFLTQIADQIGQKNILLILDNYEHLIEDVTLPVQILHNCPNLKVLITSRERLNVEEEYVLTLKGLELPTEDCDFEEVQLFESVKLFVQRAKKTRLDFQLTPETLPHALKICKMVSAYPLGIELAAVWIRMMPLIEIAKEIKKNLDFLVASSRSIKERHQSIRATFEHSWNLLSPKEKEVLRKLSVFKGGFTIKAAQTVANATLAILASLVDKSLIRTVIDGRYDRHLLIYQYTREKLADIPKELLQTQESHCQYFFDLLQQQCQDFWSGKGREALKIVDLELENIYQAWNWALESKEFSRLIKARDFVVYFHRKAKFHDGQKLFSQTISSLEQSNQTNNEVLGEMLVSLAWLKNQLGNYDKAIDLANRSLETIKSIDKAENTLYIKMKAFNTLAISLRNMGSFIEAKAFEEQALNTAREKQDLARIALYLANLALIEEGLGDYQTAESYYLEAQELNQATGDVYNFVFGLNNIGELYLTMDKIPKALQCLEKSLALAKEHNLKGLIPMILDTLNRVYYNLGQYQQAYQCLKESLEYLRNTYNPSIKAAILTSLGRIAAALNKDKKAQEHLSESLELSWRYKHIPHTIENLVCLAEIACKLGEVKASLLWWSVILEQPATEKAMKDRVRAHLDNFQKVELEEARKLLEQKNSTLESIVLEALKAN